MGCSDDEDRTSSVAGSKRRETRASKRRKVELKLQKALSILSVWSCPPQDIFDVLCSRFCARNIVAMQLVCKYWRDAVHQSVKSFAARRPDVDLDQITRVFPNITSLNLSTIDGLTLAQLSPLSKLTALSNLNLPAIEGSCSSTSPNPVINLTALRNLTSLEAHYCPALRPELSQLAQLTTLKTLALHWCSQMTDLSKLKSLQSLSLPCAYMEDTDIRALAPATGLSLLRFKVNSRALGATLAATTCLKGLQKLEMSVSSNSSTPSPWHPCSAPTGLTSLSLELYDTLFKYGLSPLADLPSLACLRLSLHWTQAPHRAVEMPAPPALTSLHVSSGSHNNTTGQVLLQAMPKLESLRLVLYHASCGGSLAALQHSPQLRKLRLQECHAVRDDALTAIATLTSVTKLKLEHLQHVTPAGLQRLSCLSALQHLVLARCRLDDSVLQALARIASLRTLALTSPCPSHASTKAGTPSRQGQFSSLGRLTALQQLWLHRLEPLSERTLARALPKLTNLRHLELQQQEGASDDVLCALTTLTGLTALTARFCRNVTSTSRTAVLQAFGPCIALDYEGCRVPDPLRPLQQPSSSTQAVLQGRAPANNNKGERPNRSSQTLNSG